MQNFITEGKQRLEQIELTDGNVPIIMMDLAKKMKQARLAEIDSFAKDLEITFLMLEAHDFVCEGAFNSVGIKINENSSATEFVNRLNDQHLKLAEQKISILKAQIEIIVINFNSAVTD